MKFIKWFRKSYELRDSLLLRYRLLLYGPSVIGLVLLLPIFWLVTEYLAKVLGIAANVPVRGHPMALWFFMGMFANLVLTVTAACVVGSLALAIGLRQLAGWSWRDIRRLLIYQEAPPHWLQESV